VRYRRSPTAILLLLLAGCRDATSAPEPPPAPEQLPFVEKLPDPFRRHSGQRVRGTAGWPARRAEISELVQRHQYGNLPPAPGRVEARTLEETPGPGGTRRLIRLSFGPGRRLYLYVGLFRPATRAPVPVIVHIDHRGPFAVPAATVRTIVERGYALAGFDPGVLDPDEPRLIGPAQAAYPDRDWATLAVWAWGAMRVADHLIAQPWVDRTRLIVTGHSRSGKAALLAGALDTRFALTVPQGSGCAGAASYRFQGPRSETLAAITKSFPHWLVPGLARFAGQEGRLPFDQHLVLTLVAPRALLTIDALGDLWASPRGTQASYLGARPVYTFLGAAGRLGIHFRPGAHLLSDDDWRTLLDFADRVLLGKQTGRRFDRLPLPVEEVGSWGTPR